jgi:hypothetical protein
MKKVINLFTGLFLYTVSAYSQCACCSSVGCGDNSGGGSALVKKGKVLFNLVGRYTNFKPLTQQQMVQDANADTSFPVYNKSYQSTYTFSLTYGISNRLNITATLPYNTITNIQTVVPGETQSIVLGTSGGISNLKTSVQFVLLQRQYGNGWEIIPNVGIIAPTGTHNNVALDGSQFDDQFQPGADAWVPVIGMSADKLFGNVTLKATAIYIFQDTHQGNVDAALWNGDVSAYMPLVKSNCGKCKTDSITKGSCDMMESGFVLSGFLGVQVEHVGQDVLVLNNGTAALNPNVGAFRTYASFGLIGNINHRLFIPISAAIPVYQQENGYQVMLNWRVNIGLSFLL